MFPWMSSCSRSISLVMRRTLRDRQQEGVMRLEMKKRTTREQSAKIPSITSNYPRNKSVLSIYSPTMPMTIPTMPLLPTLCQNSKSWQLTNQSPSSNYPTHHNHLLLNHPTTSSSSSDHRDPPSASPSSPSNSLFLASKKRNSIRSYPRCIILVLYIRRSGTFAVPHTWSHRRRLRRRRASWRTRVAGPWLRRGSLRRCWKGGVRRMGCRRRIIIVLEAHGTKT
mmetsp:Transcript_20464/g.44350  ORF Transcript_20464/g.44350 Transcript_20464/m.44350 type:complete len:224 (+) Transcript_20464:616-1287(+)